jgi:hypothetical protein
MLTDALAEQWCPRCATHKPVLCAQCKLPRGRATPTMFGEKQGGDAP